jgi:uncharacterized damage-inducible protein DinB
MVDRRYPIGEFVAPPPMSAAERVAAIDVLALLPSHLRAAVAPLAEPQLDTPYRDGGWTVRQVVHHLADSHMHSYIRFKLGATEAEPLVSDYQEASWAELSDGRGAPVELSLNLLAALHARWVLFLRALPAAGFERAFRHPQRGLMTLDAALAFYSWHCRHHLAQVTTLVEARGW